MDFYTLQIILLFGLFLEHMPNVTKNLNTYSKNQWVLIISFNEPLQILSILALDGYYNLKIINKMTQILSIMRYRCEDERPFYSDDFVTWFIYCKSRSSPWWMKKVFLGRSYHLFSWSILQVIFSVSQIVTSSKCLVLYNAVNHHILYDTITFKKLQWEHVICCFVLSNWLMID